MCEVRGEFTDFTRVAFTLRTNEGKQVKIQADRCGGNNSTATVSSTDGGSSLAGGEEKEGPGSSARELFRSMTPDATLEAQIEESLREEPHVMPYFFLQAADYIALKDLAAAAVGFSHSNNVPCYSTMYSTIRLLVRLSIVHVRRVVIACSARFLSLKMPFLTVRTHVVMRIGRGCSIGTKHSGGFGDW